MNNFLICGTIIVIFALVFYSVGIYLLQRKQLISLKVLIFITFGVIFDITATAFMIAGSGKGFISLHGVIGYSALLAMLFDCIMLWKFFKKNGKNSLVPRFLFRYSHYAFFWWIVAFITGGLLASL